MKAKDRHRANFGESAAPAHHFQPDQSIVRIGVPDPSCGSGTPLSIAARTAGCIETKAMSEIERRRTRSNVSRIDPRDRTARGHTTGEDVAERSVRLKIEAEEARHRRRREESEAAQRRWKERLVTRSVVFCGLGLCVLCAVVLLSGGYTTAEAKEWAIATLKYGSTALVAYLGGAAHKISP